MADTDPFCVEEYLKMKRLVMEEYMNMEGFVLEPVISKIAASVGEERPVLLEVQKPMGLVVPNCKNVVLSKGEAMSEGAISLESTKNAVNLDQAEYRKDAMKSQVRKANNTVSFAHAVAGPDLPPLVSKLNLRVENGKLEVPPMVIQENEKEGTLHLVAKVIGRRPEIHSFRTWASKFWHTKEGFDIVTLPNAFFLIKFRAEEDLQKILGMAPWIYEHKHLFLKRWLKGFSPKDQKITSMPIWVRLPGLPLIFWHDEILQSIGNWLGELVSIDRTTRTKSWLVAARICVYMQVEDDPPNSIDLVSEFGVWKQHIEFENLPLQCNLCKAKHRTASKSEPPPSSPSLKCKESSANPQHLQKPRQKLQDSASEALVLLQNSFSSLEQDGEVEPTADPNRTEPTDELSVDTKDLDIRHNIDKIQTPLQVSKVETWTESESVDDWIAKSKRRLLVSAKRKRN